MNIFVSECLISVYLNILSFGYKCFVLGKSMFFSKFVEFLFNRASVPMRQVSLYVRGSQGDISHARGEYNEGGVRA